MRHAKSVLRLLVTLALLVLYLQLPELTAYPTLSRRAGIPAGAVDRLRLAAAGETLTLAERDADGRWWARADAAVLADENRVQTLLQAIHRARLRPSFAPDFPDDPPVLHIAGGGRRVEIALGQRLLPLQKQLVRFGEEVYEIDADLGACLGRWQGRDGDAADGLLRRTLFQTDSPLREATLRTPFAEYELQRSDEVELTLAPDNPEQAEEVYAWTARVNGRSAKPNLAGLHRWHKQAGYLPVAAPVARRDWLDAETPYSLALTLTDGTGFEIDASGRLDPEGRHYVRLSGLPNSAPFRLTDKELGRLFARPRSLVMDLPELRLQTAEAVEVRAERGGRGYVLRREADAWRLVEPDLPYAIYTPEPEPGMPAAEVLSMAENYLARLSVFRADEAFDPADPARRRLLTRARRAVAARVSLRTAGGAVTVLELTEPVAGTEHRFLTAGDEVVVVDNDPADLVPEIRIFFDPEEIEGETIPW